MRAPFEHAAPRQPSWSSVKNVKFSEGRAENSQGGLARIWNSKSSIQRITPEVVAGGGEDGIGGVVLAVPEIVAAHPMFGFEMADDRFDGRASSQLALDPRRHPPLLA
jgi:hypothetical protein